MLTFTLPKHPVSNDRMLNLGPSNSYNFHFAAEKTDFPHLDLPSFNDHAMGKTRTIKYANLSSTYFATKIVTVTVTEYRYMK